MNMEKLTINAAFNHVTRKIGLSLLLYCIYIYRIKINIFYIDNDFSVIYSTMLILRKDLT